MSFWNWLKRIFKKPEPVVALPPPKPEPEHKPVSARKRGTPEDRLQEYADDFEACIILPKWIDRAKAKAALALKHKDRYGAIAERASRAVGSTHIMPWYVPCMLHMMESGIAQWDTYLGNGERIVGTGRKSTLVPAGRGPFATFEEGALDALTSERLRSVKVWTIPAFLQYAEGFNGWGYWKMGKRSPYLWSGSNLGVGVGKYTRDSFYDPNAVSQQIGVAVVMKAMGVE